MRVLVTVNGLPVHQLGIYRVLARQVEVHLLASVRQTAEERFPTAYLAPEGAAVHTFVPRSIRPSDNNLWWLIPGLRELVAEVRPDVLQVSSEPWGLMVNQALRAGLPVVTHSADNLYAFGPRWQSALRTYAAGRNLRRLAGYISWNSRGVELAHRYGLPPTTPTAVAAGYAPEPEVFAVAREQRAETRRLLGLDGHDFAVGFVGRITRQKGIEPLVAAARQAHDKLGRRLTLVIVGDGDLAPRLRQDAQPWLRMLGAQPWLQTQRTLAALDLLAVPSITSTHPVEQFGRVVVDAFMARVPVVSSDSGALPEVVGDAGLVVPEADPGALADAIVQVAELDGLHGQLAEKGHRRVVSHFTPEVVAARMLGVWERVC